MTACEAVSPYPQTKQKFSSRTAAETLEIVSANLDGSNQIVIKRIPIVLDQIYETIIDIAPDGTFLVYTERGKYYDY
ncbi:MAG: hypothetical protein QXJ07_01175 [Candidatus Bathyarchaeia archaeon]